MHTDGSKVSGFISLFVVQIALLLLFWIYVRYHDGALPTAKDAVATAAGTTASEDDGLAEGHVSKYPQFQDIHVMIFIGFAFLMTFLRKYGYSATGYTLFLAALIVQWAILVKGFFRMESGHISLSLGSIIDADIAAAVPLISMGALLGRTTPIQLLFMALFEVALFAVNEFIQLDILSIADVGGSITVHAFGAYFGLAVSLMLRPSKDQNDAGQNEGANYTSDIFAMIGTLFLWVYWPSFNSVLAVGAGAPERAILNTYLSLAGATVTTFVLSALVSHGNKLDMVHVQNSTLAGGVAVGSVCNLLIGPHGALLIGILSGAVSVLGYRYLSPLITEKLRLHDTCGVHNLHGMPALISAIASVIYACLVTQDAYKDSMVEIFPAMMTDPSEINRNSTQILGGYGRTALKQGGFQLLGIVITVLMAIIGGLVTGAFLKAISIKKLDKEKHHLDEVYWEVPDIKEQYIIQEVDDLDKRRKELKLISTKLRATLWKQSRIAVASIDI
ncbi:ammonium transporter Rh type A [Episyrphus balteatus]|uniref:ammonium transporter Rh type A n=1 Tax=Episyrphus balteatus TaxID=286459 RepID=UPI002485F274|nr:ammonium transporter Rh type A [Episyrphus balteatus]